jgi:hypothetical protein
VYELAEEMGAPFLPGFGRSGDFDFVFSVSPVVKDLVSAYSVTESNFGPRASN